MGWVVLAEPSETGCTAPHAELCVANVASFHSALTWKRPVKFLTTQEEEAPHGVGVHKQNAAEEVAGR
jgi:hypothetical protein